MRIIIIDDDQLVCTSLKMILEQEDDVTVCATGLDGADALPLFREYKPDILLMDIQMKRVNGTEALKGLLAEYPDANVIFLTTFVDDAYIMDALKYGAKGYIVKQNYDSILPALQAVLSGQNVFGSEVMEKIPSLIRQDTAFDYSQYGLTEKEFEIISLIADGLSNKEIASALYLSDGTLRNYISTILDKLGLRDRTQLAVFFYQNK